MEDDNPGIHEKNESGRVDTAIQATKGRPRERDLTEVNIMRMILVWVEDTPREGEHWHCGNRP